MKSRDDSISITIRRKNIQDISRENPAYADPIYGPPPNQLKHPYREFLKKLKI